MAMYIASHSRQKVPSFGLRWKNVTGKRSPSMCWWRTTPTAMSEASTMRLSEWGGRAGMVQYHTSDEGILDVIFIERGDRSISSVEK